MIASGQPAPLSLEDLPGMNARAFGLLAGPGGGKTTALAALVFARGVRSVVAVDPAGELSRLVEDDARCVVVTVPADWREARVGDALVIPWVVGQARGGARVVVDLSGAYRSAPEFVDALAEALIQARPPDLLLIVEECQRFLGQSREGLSPALLAAWEMGRNWRWGRVLATQRPASVSKEALARCDTLLLGRMQQSHDVAAVRDLLSLNIPDAKEREEVLRAMFHFSPGEFILREPETPPGVNE